jgi:hypothetical protein
MAGMRVMVTPCFSVAPSLAMRVWWPSDSAPYVPGIRSRAWLKRKRPACRGTMLLAADLGCRPDRDSVRERKRRGSGRRSAGDRTSTSIRPRRSPRPDPNSRCRRGTADFICSRSTSNMGQWRSSSPPPRRGEELATECAQEALRRVIGEHRRALFAFPRSVSVYQSLRRYLLVGGFGRADR